MLMLILKKTNVYLKYHANSFSLHRKIYPVQFEWINIRQDMFYDIEMLKLLTLLEYIHVVMCSALDVPVWLFQMYYTSQL